MTRKKKIVLVFSLVFFFSLAGIILLTKSWATVVFRLETQHLVEGSDLILMGVVNKKVSQEIREEGGIYTFTTILVESVLKGYAGPEVVVKEFGGKVGRIVDARLGAPSFREGERVLVFLRDIGSGFYRVFGLSQGKFSIIEEEISGRDILYRDLLRSGLDFIEGPPEQVGGEPDQLKIYLEDYLELVRNLSTE